MTSAHFKKSVERQIKLRTRKTIALPAHFSAYMVKRGVVNPPKGLNDRYRFNEDDVEAAVTWLRKPRFTQFEDEQ